MNELVTNISLWGYTSLLPIAQMAFFITVFIFAPLSLIKSIRLYIGAAYDVVSYIFGATTWFLGCSITFLTWGWAALLIGLLLFGVGVVPIAIVASFVALGNYELGFSLIAMSILTYAARIIGNYYMSSSD